MRIRVRRTTVADAKIVANFNSAIAEEAEHPGLDRKRLLHDVERLLKDASKGCYILAEVKGRIVRRFIITCEWSDCRAATFGGFTVYVYCPVFAALGFSPYFSLCRNGGAEK